jgi:hypothetical protein
MSETAEQTAAGDGESLTPAQLIGEMNALRDRASAAARGYCLPLLLFGALICGSLPFYQRLARARPDLARPTAAAPCRAIVNHPCHVSVAAAHVMVVVVALGYYWQIAIPAGVLLTVLWYRWRGNRVGLRTPARGFLITGLVLGEAVLLVPLLAGQSNSVTLHRLMHDTHQAGPLVIIAALLWVLAWAERSPALAIIVAIYLATALVVTQFTNGGLAGGDTGAADLAMSQLRLLGLLPALVLLAAGAGAWLAQRLHLRSHTPASGNRAHQIAQN